MGGRMIPPSRGSKGGKRHTQIVHRGPSEKVARCSKALTAPMVSGDHSASYRGFKFGVWPEILSKPSPYPRTDLKSNHCSPAPRRTFSWSSLGAAGAQGAPGQDLEVLGRAR